MNDPFALYRVPTAGKPRAEKSAAEEEYQRILESVAKKKKNNQARQAVTRITDNPDTSAEARRLGRTLNVPAPAVEQNIASYRADERRTQVANVSRDPRFGDWMGRHSEVASDDVASMLLLGDASEKYNYARRFSVEAALEQNGLTSQEITDRNFKPRELSTERRAELRKQARSEQEYRSLVSRAVLKKNAPTAEEWAERERLAEAERRMERGFIGQVFGSLRAGTYTASGGLYGVGAAAMGLVGFEDAERGLLDVVRATSEAADADRAMSTGFVSDSLYQGLESIPASVAAVLVGLGTGGAGGTAFLASTTGGNAYASGREGGLGVGQSFLYGTTDGAIEYITERVPVGALVNMSAGKSGIGRAMKRFVVGEMLGEQAATALQDFNHFMHLEPNATLADYLAARPEAAARTALGTISGAGPQALAAYGLRKAFKEESRIQSSEARLQALGELMQHAADSKVRERDPAAFRELLDRLAEGGDTVFIPAEAIRELNQDYANDEFWGDYAGEIQEALTIGGDVSISVTDMATRLAGSETWSAIEESIRVGPDGMTRNEIDAANAEIDALIEDAGEQLDIAEMEAQRERAPALKLRENIRAQLMNTGMTPDVANANAEIVASLFETEAANLGRTLTGNEFSDNIAVQRVLPELLSAPEASDTLDLVINAMRQGKDSQVGIGPSLLKFIKDRGGINDPGGDLKSMGLPSRFIRAFNPDQGALGGISGEGDYGIDSTLRAAIEAGYFPELQGVEQEAGPSQLDTQALLDAIERELAGEKVFSETRTDEMRAAAEELRQMIESRGLDPDAVTTEQIRELLDEFDSEQGATYNQDTIEIDGIERPTVNSNGQPLAVTEEGLRNFWAWFGDSKVVDAEGRPLVVYHGTNAEFEAFELQDERNTATGDRTFGDGFYFTPAKDMAQRYSDGGKLLDVSLAILNPREVVSLSDDHMEIMAMRRELGSDGMTAALREQGFDGLLFKARSGAIDQAIAFDPTQIKSVNNVGTFDPNDARILYQRAFHGSTVKFDKFLKEKIGASGVTKFGHGFYFADKKEIAREYATSDGRIFEVEIPEDRDLIKWDEYLFSQPFSVAEVIEAMDKDGEVDSLIKDFEEHEDAPFSASADDLVRRYVEFGEARAREDLTDWGDDDLIERLDAIRSKFEVAFEDSTGGDVYDLLAGTLGSQELASELFSGLGVKGVKAEDKTLKEGGANYVIFDDSDVSVRAYEQNRGQGPQGQITIGDAQSIIKLFENSNLSTFQHEVAHFWLERFKGNALQTIATDGNSAARQTFADWETLKAWFKENGHEVGEDGVIPTEAHELFARSWERYLMEGKAPKASLQSVFRKFASWMRAIYRKVKNLNAPITPEVREVMDRMLATEEQIAIANDERSMRLMFDDAVDAGMSEDEAKRYAELGEEARSEAEEELYGKVFRSVRAREQKQWREAEKSARKEITENVERRPIFKALSLLRDTERLDTDWVKETYGEDAVGLLPAGVPPIHKQGGGNADQIAEMAGFESGDKMVRELMGLEKTRRDMKAAGDKRSVKKATIDQEVAQEMAERFGDPLNDGTIEREALSAVQNERQGERLEMELRALGSKTNKRATPYALAREWARDRIATGVVADTISGEAQYRYTRTASKAAREAQNAFLRGDNEEAFRHKQTEMLHNALAREAAQANERVEKAIKRLGNLAKQRTVKSMAQDYLDRIHGLLEGFEFKRVSQRQIDARDEYARWAQEQVAAGHDVVAVERLAQKKNWSRMTVEELTALDDAVKQLVHLGRHKQTLMDNKERRELEAVIGEAVMSAAQLPQKKRKGQFGGETRTEWIKSGFASLHSVLVKMEDVFDRLDNGNSHGVFNRVAFKPMVEAQAREQEMLDDVMGRLIQAMKDVPKPSIKRWQQRVTIDELVDPRTGEPANFLGEELIVMAMNMGNRGNMEKLIGGFGWDKQLGGMENARAVVMDVLNRELTVEDWQYVQTVWDIVNELWPEISALEKRVNGFSPEKVEAVPINTSAGTLAGGYFPVVYDPESRVGGRNLEVEEQGLFPSTYFRSSTRAGSTHERTNFKGPLHLSLGVINRHVAEVVHDITHREAVINADKFLSSDAVQSAVTDALGPEIAKQFRPWLSHIANEWATDREGNSQAERFLKATRTNATVVGLGFRISTIMLQVSGYANSIERVGLRYVLRGMRKQFTNPASWTFALDTSKELRSRMTSMDRDIRDNAKKLASKQGGVLDAAQQFAFHGIGYMDRMVSTGTWLGAYDKALANGMTEDQAVYEADKAVRQSQGSGAAKDMARVQRGTGKMGEAWKLSTMFYSYSSAFYQRQVRLYQDIGDAVRERSLETAPELAARFLWLNIVPALLSQLLAGRGPEDDEDEGAWALAEIMTAQFQAIPFAREIAGGLNSGFGYSYTPAEGFGKSIVSVVQDAGRLVRGEETKRATRNFMDAVGYTTGKVPGQFGQTTQFLVDVGYGEQDPETLAEWWEGITKGKIKE